jgi:phospholipase/lecithinase/hemolysin
MDHIHPTPLGHKLIGETLFREIKDEIAARLDTSYGG